MAVIQYSGVITPSPLDSDVAVGYTPAPNLVDGLEDVITFAYRLDANQGNTPTDNTESFENTKTYLSVTIQKTPRNLNIDSGLSSINMGDDASSPSTWIVNRLHFLPEVVDLGVLTGFKTTYFNVWCTYLRPQQLTNVTPTNAAGLTLDTQISVPSDMQSFGYYPMSILSDPEGQDKIDATFTYNMLNGDTYDLRVTGLRSSVFGYRHNWASTLVETYTWLTGVTTAVTGDEQRMPLRYYPRVQVNQVAVIAEEQLNQFRARMATWHSQNYTVPLWQRQVILAVQALANQPVLTVDNVELGAKAGDQIMLTLGWDDYEILQVDSVTDTTVTLQSDLKSSWRVGSVVTLVVAGTSRSPVLVRGLTSTKAALDSITFDIAPEDIATFIPADSGRIGLYNNSPIMPLRPNWAEDIPEQYSKPMTKKVDYQASSPVYYDDMEIAQHQIDWAYLVGGKTNISLLREFLFYIEGRHRSFWQPTYTKDFKIAKLYEAGFSTLTVENNNYISELWGLAQYKHICVETHTGIYYREITNVSLDVDSKLVLTLDTPIAEEMDANTVRNISFLQKWRLNSDTITLIYSTDAVVTCSLSMITTVGT